MFSPPASLEGTQRTHMDEDQAVIDEDQCVACGRCVDACTEDAIKITMEDSDYIKNTIEKISENVDCT
jgi:NAD-dependent dihydropyrimidine dehydrogenase PreA subunit